ncbi:MAG: hypothetical protein CMJ59_17720 [Planctomycetaceae bacterium]|nr:hypothetical protein [Planctomycetaceae bacterium]
MNKPLLRRRFVQHASTLAVGAGWIGSRRRALAADPIAPGRARVWQPLIDLHFADDRGLAQWWLPELVLLGNTDVSLRAQGTVRWEQPQPPHWGYQHLNPDGQLTLRVSVRQITNGWLAALTVGNQSRRTWPHVVCPVCLLLRASGSFEDPDWRRTFYRSDGDFLPYHGRATNGGRDIFRMSLVRGQRQIERTERHQKKWGFTKQPSDDGVIGVVSRDRSTVLTTTWKPTHHLQANLKRTFSCVHANPYLGTIEPGEAKTVHGCVLLTAGDLAAAWESTRRVIREQPEAG